jgi:hypothetical protein
MHKITVYKTGNAQASISQLGAKRDWMDETWEAHSYKCFPVSLTNQLGWGISFPEDISFIWDGISDSSPDHVKILKGEKYAYTGRSNATISFKTGLKFVTDENVSILQMPVPNYINDGVMPFTTLITSSFFNGELPVAWRITKPNVEITIKANTPVISLIPIDLSSLQNSEITLKDFKDMPEPSFDVNEYAAAVNKINQSGNWANFYRNATDHHGNKLGSHQVKAIRLSVQDKSLDN